MRLVGNVEIPQEAFMCWNWMISPNLQDIEKPDDEKIIRFFYFLR
jgi:hypothetical protein